MLAYASETGSRKVAKADGVASMERTSSEVAVNLQRALESLPGFVVPSDFGRFHEHIDPAWIEEALRATGTASLRRRRLTAEQAIWLVLGMALLRRESIERVAMMLGLALPAANGQTAAKSSLAQVRSRLGEKPLAFLFAVTADRWARESADRHRWRGLSDGFWNELPDNSLSIADRNFLVGRSEHAAQNGEAAKCTGARCECAAGHTSEQNEGLAAPFF